MPMKREPSQRTKAWVKWNYGSNSTKSSVPSTPTEIVHLGGSRIESTPPTPPSERETSTTQDFPAKSGFATPYPAPEPPVDSARAHFEPERNRAPSPTYSPVEITASGLNASSPRVAGPADKPTWPLRSASLKNSKPRYTPSFSSTSSGASAEPTRTLQRSQSAANADRYAGQNSSKVLPPWLMEALNETESDTQESANAKHVGQQQKKDARITQWFPLPELVNPPPTRPLPVVKPTPTEPPKPTEVRVVTIEPKRAPAATQPPKTAKVVEAAKLVAAVKIAEPKGNTTKSTLSRHSPLERLWLHQNYRGEATFLKAWGLNIEYQEDREEGLLLLRELMGSEDENSSRNRQKASAAVLPDRGMRIVIDEPGVPFSETERLDAKVGSQMSGMSDERTQALIWASNGAHKRSETEHSVLGSYLNARMSRVD